MSDTLQVLPGFSHVIEFGYNAVSGTFAGESVFQLSYDGVRTAEMPQGIYLVPDGTNADPAGQSFTSSTTDLMETTSDYDEYFSASVSGSGSYMGYSASASSEIAFRGSLFQQKSSYYAVNFGIYKAYWGQRNVLGALAPDFASALAALPSECKTGAEFAAFYSFFDKYGTHYFQSGAFGCYFAMQTAIESSYVEKSTQKDVSATVNASFESLTASGSLSVSAAYGSSALNSESKENFTFECFTYGGDGSVAQTPETGIQDFYATAFQAPILLINLDPTLADSIKPATVSPLSDLIGGLGLSDASARVSAFHTALQGYIDRAAEADGILSNPRDIDIDDSTPGSNPVQLTATRDQFVVASITRVQGSNGDRATLAILSDAPNSKGSVEPTTVRAQTSMSYHTNNDAHLFVSSLTTPVRSGDPWIADYVRTCQYPSLRVSVQELQLTNGASLGAWQTVASGAMSGKLGPLTAETPGFLVGNITCQANGDSGQLIASLGAPEEQGDTDPYAAASAGYNTSKDAWLKCNSFCLPVPAGYQYSLSANCLGKATWNAFWIPLVGDQELLRAPLADTGAVKQAETDGFLVGMIWTTSKGARGWIQVYTSDNPNDLQGDNWEEILPQLATCVDYDPDHYLAIQYNAVCVPIPRGMWYRAVVATKDQGESKTNIGSAVHWFPLIETPLTPE